MTKKKLKNIMVLKDRLNANKKEILFKAVKVFFIRVLGYGSGFLLTWLIANKLGAKTQGIFSIAFLFLSVGVMISKLGVDTSIIKWIANTSSINKQKFILFKSIKLTLISSLIISIILFFSAELISKMYDKPDVFQSIRIASIGIPILSVLSVISSFFVGRKETTTFGIYFHLLKFLLPLLCIITLLLFHFYEIEVPITSFVIGIIVALIIMLIHIYILFNKIPIDKVKHITTTFVLKESYPVLVNSSIVMIMGWSDVFILGFYVSESDIGVYSTAIKLATLVSFTYNAIATIVMPKIADFYHKKDTIQLNETVFFSSKMMLLCSLPCFIILFIFPEYVLSIFGEEYIQGKNVLRILLLAQIGNVITGPVGPIFEMTNKQKILQRFIMISLMFNIVLSVLLVRHLGLIGVAIGTAVGMVFWNIRGAFYIFNDMKIKTWVSLKKIMKNVK